MKVQISVFNSAETHPNCLLSGWSMRHDAAPAPGAWSLVSDSRDRHPKLQAQQILSFQRATQGPRPTQQAATPSSFQTSPSICGVFLCLQQSSEDAPGLLAQICGLLCCKAWTLRQEYFDTEGPANGACFSGTLRFMAFRALGQTARPRMSEISENERKDGRKSLLRQLWKILPKRAWQQLHSSTCRRTFFSQQGVGWPAILAASWCRTASDERPLSTKRPSLASLAQVAFEHMQRKLYFETCSSACSSHLLPASPLETTTDDNHPIVPARPPRRTPKYTPAQRRGRAVSKSLAGSITAV